MFKASLPVVIWKHRSLLLQLIKRDFSGKYNGSFGGVIWSFIHPLFLLSVYTVSFGVILKSRWGFSGSTLDYALMLFAGLIIFNLFTECLIKSTSLITSNPNFVKKIVFPLELLPIIVVATSLIHALIGVSVWLIVYSILFGIPYATALLFPLVLLTIAPVLLGLGWLFSSLGVIVKDINQVTGLINHSLLFLTPIFYSIEAVPAPLQKFLILNPLTFVVEQFRLVLFYGKAPCFQGMVIYFLIATFFALLSLILFRRLRPNFADLL